MPPKLLTGAAKAKAKAKAKTKGPTKEEEHLMARLEELKHEESMAVSEKEKLGKEVDKEEEAVEQLKE